MQNNHKRNALRNPLYELKNDTIFYFIFISSQSTLIYFFKSKFMNETTNEKVMRKFMFVSKKYVGDLQNHFVYFVYLNKIKKLN